MAKVSGYRGLLVGMTPPDFDVLDAIANDPDIAKTYKGYKKFLMSERDDHPNRSRSQTERENSAIAKAMILRGKVSSPLITDFRAFQPTYFIIGAIVYLLSQFYGAFVTRKITLKSGLCRSGEN
jgi:hypothetical protein